MKQRRIKKITTSKSTSSPSPYSSSSSNKFMEFCRTIIFPVRRLCLALSARLKSRKNGAGLLKLQDDVQTCGYQDVQVMWEMLQRTEGEVVLENHQKRKQLPFWRIFVWSNHSEVSSESANNHS
ncbi:hypothetical protein Fmac_020125 [Flemingia macrophylla]|uniref:Uncharacterized protein n=1 Tax=Flemingia macrophylla TaxID=520843 RepID=A0ABD1M9R2_9FABA